MLSFTVVSPLEVNLQRKKKQKKFILNLNNYRNEHYQVLNQAKIAYKAAVRWQISKLPCLGIVSVEYVLYPKTKRLTDIPNVLSIHDKFFMDSLVELGRLKDDNYLYHVSSSYTFGEVDKLNPRVDILITETINEVR